MCTFYSESKRIAGHFIRDLRRKDPATGDCKFLEERQAVKPRIQRTTALSTRATRVARSRSVAVPLPSTGRSEGNTCVGGRGSLALDMLVSDTTRGGHAVFRWTNATLWNTHIADETPLNAQHWTSYIQLWKSCVLQYYAEALPSRCAGNPIKINMN